MNRPTKYDQAFTLRVDEEFHTAIVELQRTHEGDELPSKSDVIRSAVLEMRDRRRKAAERRK